MRYKSLYYSTVNIFCYGFNEITHNTILTFSDVIVPQPLSTPSIDTTVRVTQPRAKQLCERDGKPTKPLEFCKAPLWCVPACKACKIQVSLVHTDLQVLQRQCLHATCDGGHRKPGERVCLVSHRGERSSDGFTREACTKRSSRSGGKKKPVSIQDRSQRGVLPPAAARQLHHHGKMATPCGEFQISFCWKLYRRVSVLAQ